MLYLDNAATSFPKPPGVSAAIVRFLAEAAANPGRAGHRMAVAAERMLDDARLKLARLFDAPDPQRMIFAMNGTDALNMAIKGVLGNESGGRGVITTVLEHNSVSRPLTAMRDRGQIDLTRVDCDDQGFVDPDDIRKAIRASTRLIVVTHASNVLGTIQDAAAIGAIARSHGVLFCLDAAQTAGVVPISVQQMNIDLLAFPGHKSLLGPTGTGGLYVGDRCPPPSGATGGLPASACASVCPTPPPSSHAPNITTSPIHQFTNSPIPTPSPQSANITPSHITHHTSSHMSPWREGGTGGDSATPTQPPLYPYYLEGGTPNTVGIAGLSAALDYLATRPISQTLDHERNLIRQIIDRLAADQRFTLYGSHDPTRRVGTVSLNIRGLEAPDVAAILDDTFHIAVRPGLHCAPYIHRRLGTFPNGTVRISPGPFNTPDDVSALLDALTQIAASSPSEQEA